MPEALLAIEKVAVEYAAPHRRGERAAPRRAVDGVSLEVRAGETVALVGESGCGKTTLARAVLGLVPLTSGEVRFEGQVISGRSARALKPVRRRMQLVFQASETALDPRRTVGQSIAEGLVIHSIGTKATQHTKVLDLLQRVGLPVDVAERRPDALSGGQRQRVGIARALALDPVLLIADEPTSALDTSVQLQILDLFLELQRALHLTMLFISHDLASVRYLGARTVVMHRGRLVEEAG